MIEAGAAVLRDHADGCIGPYTAKHIAETVFAAMQAAAVEAGLIRTHG
jgi:hypothetical protein